MNINEIEERLRPEYYINGDNYCTLEEAMQANSVPGISVAVIYDYKIIFNKAYGLSDTENSKIATSETIFQAASISKPITAMAVLKLVQDGILNLDENINTYLKTWKLPESEFTKNSKVTLRNLLSHTAGITIHGFPGYNSSLEIPSLQQVLKGESPANTSEIKSFAEPDTLFSYSGGGYTIVQQALVDQLQKPFEDIMKELVLTPLEMNSSFYSCTKLDEELSSKAAAGHYSDGNQVLGKRHLYPEMAAAGLWTTAEDLAKFAIEVQRALKGESNKIITQEFAELMATPILKGSYNLGLGNEKVGEVAFIGHNGGNEGFSCTMLFHKTKGYGFVLMTNSDNGYNLKLPLFRSIASVLSLENILAPNYEFETLTEDTIKLFSHRFKESLHSSIEFFQAENGLAYKNVFYNHKELDYVGNHTFIDKGRNLRFSEKAGKFFKNNEQLELLENADKLPSDFIEANNFDAALNYYKELKDISLEASLNNFGYNCLGRESMSYGIGFLKLATMLFPTSPNAWDSLGEAYFMNKEYELCIEAMEKALELNPNNSNSVAYIEKCKGLSH